MDIAWVEALSRLKTWRDAKTSLEVTVSRPGLWLELWGTIREIRGFLVEIDSAAGKLRLELQDAIFEWGDDAPSTSHFTAGLSAKFRNGDAILFSVLREVTS
jgi:hypothetical protein